MWVRLSVPVQFTKGPWIPGPAISFDAALTARLSPPPP